MCGSCLWILWTVHRSYHLWSVCVLVVAYFHDYDYYNGLH